MINIKGYAIVQDGAVKRMAITYDEINSEGKVINPNARVNRVVVDDNALSAILTLDAYAKSVIENEV